MDELEKKVAEKETQVLKIIHAADYITAKLSQRYGEFSQWEDGSGNTKIEGFCGYNIEVHGQPIVLPGFFERTIGKRWINSREYMVVKQVGKCGVVGCYAFGAKYRGSEKNIVVKGIWEEKLAGFMEIANKPKKYVREYLKRKKEEELNHKRWIHMHRKEIAEKTRKQKLISKAKNLQVRFKEYSKKLPAPKVI